MNETKKRRGRPSVYTDADRDIMREEIAKGRKGWVVRAGARIKGRSLMSIQAHASVHGLTDRSPFPLSPSAAPSVAKRPLAPRKPSSANVPDFLRDEFAKWNP